MQLTGLEIVLNEVSVQDGVITKFTTSEQCLVSDKHLQNTLLYYYTAETLSQGKPLMLLNNKYKVGGSLLHPNKEYVYLFSKSPSMISLILESINEWGFSHCHGAWIAYKY